MTSGSCNVLGVRFNPVNMITASEAVLTAARDGTKGYVCVTGVHGVMEARKNPDMLRILNAAFLNVPDGMPISWIGHAQGFKDMDRVYGPDLMARICEESTDGTFTHFLYGGQEGVAQDLKTQLENRYPGIKIMGTYTPPFRPLNHEEEYELASMIASLKPDFFWVGLSTPKQETFMAAMLSRLDTSVMFGVGAAFDIHTGRIKDAPQWMKRAGLQWFYRLCREPRRLAKRYLINNPLFIFKITCQFLGIRTYRQEGSS